MSVAKMKDGKRWYVFVRYKDWTGTTQQHKKEGFKRQADAKEYERQFIELHAGSSKLTVRGLYQIYIEDCRSRMKPTTMINKEDLFDLLILPYLGKLVANEVTPADIRRWQTTLLSARKKNGGPYAPTYLKAVNSQASALFNFGVKYYGLNQNPFQKAGSMGRARADVMQFWTMDEFKLFIEAVSDRPLSLVAFSLLYWTGMRSGELMALTPSDFDFSANTVRIDETYARHKKRDILQEPKTEKSRRVITMPPFLSRLVKQYIDTLYDIQPDDRIFSSISKGVLYREMERGSKAAGVKRIRLHDLRHSHASLLIEMNYSPLLIAERLGHDDVETTLRTYSHLYPNKQSQLAEDLEGLNNATILLRSKTQ